ncbi:hypothetical protein ACHAXR_013352 [Thalassiosira sp. AJA248-18]
MLRASAGNRYSSRGRNNYNGPGSSRGRGHGGRRGGNDGDGGRNNQQASSWDSRGGGGRARGNPSHPSNDTTAVGGGGGGDDAPPDTEPALRVLSFYEQGSRIAFACYSEDVNEIVFEDAVAHNGADTERIVQGVLLETRPNLILVGNKVVANAPLLECLTTMPLGSEEDNVTNNHNRGQQGTEEGQQAQATAQPESTQTADASQTSSPRGVTIPYQLLKSSAFEPRQCRSVILHKLRVLTLMRQRPTTEDFSHAQNYTASLGGLHGGASAQPSSNFHSLASIINFDSNTLVRALGSLLSYLRNTAFRLEEGFTVTINNIRRCPASDSFLRLEESTLRTLRIFATDHHPLMANNNVKGRSYQKSKEGFSLFTLLDRTKSKAGRERLRQWMKQPLRDVKKIRQRHVGIELFLHPDCHPAVSLLLERLSDVGSMDSILLRMQRCCAQPNDFLVLGRMLDAAYAIIATLGGELRERAYKLDRENDEKGMDIDDGTIQQHAGETGREQQEYPSVTYLDELLRRCHVPVTRNLRERMASVIDEEVTAEAKDHVVVHYGFNEELDRAKETFETLDETLSEVGRQVLAKHQDLISLKVVFLPQVGFLVSIDKRQHAHDETSFPNIPEDFEFVFVQDNDAFFKSDEMNQLDEEIGDLDAFIKDTEALIVSDLEEEVLECESELRSTFSALADLDCILSLAGCAADLNFVKPEIASAEEGIIHIEQGRHPLQELIVNDEFIPNDTMMDNDNRVMIVTGPNFSGKSCYARQVGVIAYLAHVGSYLPCECAKISVMDQIIVNFGDVETCSVPQSTFQRDLTQMAGIMRKSTPNTLVLIDEFGKGESCLFFIFRTAPTSGIAVMTSAIQRLAQSKCKVVCTTHFLEMFSLGLLEDAKGGIKAVTMSIHVPESNEDEAVPLFKLENGVASSSAGLVCARMAGLNRKVVDRASDIITALKEGKQVRPLPESVNANSPFQPNVRSAIRLFLAVDSWANATEEDLDLLQELVDRM